MMASKALPLLLLGGAALLVMGKKKSSGSAPAGPIPVPPTNGVPPRPSGGGTTGGGAVPGGGGTASKAVWMDRQRALGFLGYDVGTVDGLYGPATANALREFQTDAAIPVTGVWDQPTAEVMRRAGLQRLATMSWDKIRQFWNYYFPQWSGQDDRIEFDKLFEKLTAIVT